VKSKKIIQLFGKYLRELSVVVVGIAITFGISSLINDRNSKKDIEQYLNTIKLELKTNIEEIENQINALEESVEYSHYLLSVNKRSLNSDTIQKYSSVITHNSSYKPKYNAFEMFKSSGSMRLISDKELLLSIWEAYSDIDYFHLEFETFYQMKRDKLIRERESVLSGKKAAILMYDFFTSGYDIDLLRRCKINLKNLNEIVAKVEKAK